MRKTLLSLSLACMLTLLLALAGCGEEGGSSGSSGSIVDTAGKPVIIVFSSPG